VKTPNIDKLVENGVSFQRAYNMGAWNGAVCVASRHMFNTGRYVWNCNTLIRQEMEWSKENKEKPFPDIGKSWSQLLSGAGYKTYFAGKWHVKLFDPEKIFDVVGTVRPGMPKQTPEGYNRPLDENDTTWLPWDKSREGYWQGGTHWSEVLRDEAIGFIEQAAKEDNPFFMYIAFNAPHDPRQSPKEYVELYPLDSIHVPENFLPEYPYAEEICGKQLRDERLMPYPRTEYAVKVNRAEYYALITHMDEQIGRILQALEKSGKLDNTYIFYTADHGLAAGHHGLVGKQNMYEHSLGAPLIVNAPGLEKGKRITERVYIQDIVPSSLELAGAAQPEAMEFESLMPLIKGDKEKGRTVIYGAYMNRQRCVIQGDWKLMYYPSAAKYRLFNVARDPNEMNDLSENPECADQLEKMKQALIREMKEQNDPLLLDA
jgi:arylsulfatase A-like enzyme